MDVKKLGYMDVECIQLAQDRDTRRAVVNSMINLEVEFFPLWTVTLRQWIIGSLRFEATYCRHLQRLLGYFEHWRWGYYLITLPRQVGILLPIDGVSHPRRIISAVIQLIFSKIPGIEVTRMIWSLWLTEQLLASQDWPCRVGLFSNDARKALCREGQKLKSSTMRVTELRHSMLS
jgi:hypothetical protein